MHILIFLILLLITSNIFFIVLYSKKKNLSGSVQITAKNSDRTELFQEDLVLQDCRMKLEQMIEEKTKNLEEANQELQTLNEELDRSNEEYQTINEELNEINKELEFSNNALSKEIEEHKKTQAEKDIIEEKLNQFISQSSEAIIIINDKGIVEDWNKTMAQITGITKENAVGQFIWDVTYMMSYDPDKAEFFRESFKNHTLHFFEEIKKGNWKEMSTESQIKHHDGSQRYIHTTLFPIITDSGNYGGVIISDIIQRKAIEAELETYRNELEKILKQKTEHLEQLSVRFNEVYDNSSDAITFMDIMEDGKIIKVFDMNPISKKLFKVTDEQLARGVYIEDILPEIKIESFRQHIFPKLLSGVPVTFTEERDTGNGCWNSTIYPVQDENAKVFRIAAFSRNVTAEYENEKTSAILQSAIESWPYEFWVSNKEGVCILQNKASQILWGDLIGKKLTDLDTPDDTRKKSMTDELKVLQGIPASSELVFETKEGLRYVLVNLYPIYSRNEITGFVGIHVDITHQKMAEIALKESEKRLNQLLSSITDFKFTAKISDNKLISTVHSEGCLSVTGYSPAEFQNNPNLWFEMIHEDDKQLLKEWAEKVENGIEPEPIEHRIIHKNREIIWVSNTTVLRKDSKGKLLGFDGLISDITKRKIAELALRESEKRFYDAIDLQPLPMGIIIDGKPLFYNRNFTERFGYTIEDVPTVEKWLERTISDSSFREKILIDVKAAITERNNFDVTKYNRDFKILCKDGSEKWIEISDRRIGNMLVTVFNDITERKESEEKIRRSEELYRLLAENIDDVIWKMDIKTLRYTYFSPSVVKLTGYTVEEALQLNSEQILMPDSIKDLAVNLTEWIKQYNNTRQGITRSFEYQIRHKNGFPVWVEINAAFITDNSGEIQEIVATSRSIEERKASEMSLIESEEKLKTIFNTSKDGIILLNRNLEIFDINNSAIKRSGFTREEIVGKKVLGFLDKKEGSLLAQHLLSIWDKELIDNFETEVTINNEGTFPVEISASILHIDKQEMLLLMIRDISERKQLEKQLLQSVIDTEEKERVNFSQELHDGLGPLLSAAKMYTEWLAEPGQGVDTKIIISDIQKLLEESTRTVKDISFKLSPHVLQNYGIVEALNAYSDKAVKSGKTRILIQAENVGRYEKTIETIIYRVVCECINNSLKYAKASNIIVNLAFTENILSIDFSDDGIGFDVSKVYENHKGIGIMNIQSRLKSINGQFSLQSEMEHGTKISIKIPLNA